MTRMSDRKRRLCVEFSETVRERGKYREVIMEFSPWGVEVRLKGLRSSYPISAAGIFNHAVRLAVEKKRQEKKEKRRGNSR